MENKRDMEKADDISSIVKALDADPDAVSKSEIGDGRVEFSFDSDASAKSAPGSPELIFEYVPLEFVAEEMPEEVKRIAEAEAEANRKAEEEKERAKAEAKDKEFAAARIWTTYVPRFTEFSEHYRMKDDPRPRVDKEGRPISPAPQAAKAVDAAKEEAEDAAEVEVDPTAEVDGEVDNAVIVERARPEPEDGVDTLNVYKFSDKEKEEPEKRERTVDDERADIDKLFVRDEKPEEKVEEEKADPVPEVKEKKNYDIPDPDVRVRDFSREEEDDNDLPDGAGQSETGKKVGTEFTLNIQRDSIKDKFLDSIFSVKIRLCAAALFSLVLLAFEGLCAFGLFATDIFGIPTLPVARGMIDLLFAACGFLVVLPEVIRAFKLLFRRKLAVELVLPVALVVLIGYYAAVIATDGLFDYPLYGFMFSILPVCAVLSSLYRKDADFTAFKLISRSTDKDVLQKKATRALEEENMALDGIIDEYKSRTARIFHTSFVTDFFKGVSDMREPSRRSAILIGVSLAVALASGLIAFFALGGLFNAVSTFTLVFLLSVPAFSVLSHKISYYDSQLAALTEDSTAVGEAGFDEFSDVDVIAFDDTEIFGPDDVNLKRFML